MAHTIHSIVHPTDFSDISMDAFAHALRIALAAKSWLYLLHVGEWSDEIAWSSFPHVRRVLSQWGLMEETAPQSAVAELVGIKVVKVQLGPRDPLSAMQEFLDKHPSELVVLGTHGREGLQRLLHGSMAEKLSRLARVPTLFIPPGAAGFVDRAKGNLDLKTILVPVDHDPPAENAIAKIRDFAQLLNESGTDMRFLHVGTGAPEPSVKAAVGPGFKVELQTGDTIEVIVQTAKDIRANMIALPTAGHHGFLDAIRGSTSERILRKAPCAVLAVPT